MASETAEPRLQFAGLLFVFGAICTVIGTYFSKTGTSTDRTVMAFVLGCVAIMASVLIYASKATTDDER